LLSFLFALMNDGMFCEAMLKKINKKQ